MSIVYLGNYFYLKNTGELYSVMELVDRQLEAKKNGLYSLVGLRSSDLDIPYKIEMYKRIKPTIAAIGSSRVMLFKESFFNKSFYSLGGAARSSAQLKILVDKILPLHSPEIAIIGIDQWWFIEEKKAILKDKLGVHKLREPFFFLKSKKISFSDFFYTIFNKDNDVARIGVMAAESDSGFAPDGSYAYSNIVAGITPSPDIEFSLGKENINKGRDHYVYGKNINEQRFKDFVSAIKALQLKDVKVVLFFPPFAPTIVQEMHNHKEQYEYLNELRYKLKQENLDFYDFHNPAQIQSTDCEFIDSHHGGELTYARIIKSISNSEKNILEPYVNTEFIRAVLSSYNDLAMLPDKRIHSGTEIDFLQLGCSKQYSLDISSISKNIDSIKHEETIDINKFLHIIRNYKDENSLDVITNILKSNPGLINQHEYVMQTTPLLVAVRDVKSPALVKLLLKMGANINGKNRHKHNALHLAVHDNLLEIVPILLENNADIFAKDIAGYDAWGYAKLKNNSEMKQIISKKYNVAHKLLKYSVDGIVYCLLTIL